jgi:CRISPR/Cas system CMR subunit Cmr4 (Cas7 group RAMP superfamily)
MREAILSAIRQKSGIRDIRLEITENKKARVIINQGKIIKNFINQADALQWLIHAYNIKHFKKSLSPSYILQNDNHEIDDKASSIEESSQKIFEKISNFEYYTSEIYRTLLNDFDQLRFEKNFTSMEMNQIYTILIKRVQQLKDDTFSHKRYQVYKKYQERLSELKNGY